MTRYWIVQRGEAHKVPYEQIGCFITHFDNRQGYWHIGDPVF